MLERERKFILKYLPDGLVSHKIQQGYLILQDDKHLRIRIVDDIQAYITYKTFIDITDRNEYEYEIPIWDGLEMLSTTNIKLEKIRYKTTFNGNNVDIDIYNDGKKIVEIEYSDTLTDLPDYCGEEVTNNEEYSNINIAKNNVTDEFVEHFTSKIFFNSIKDLNELQSWYIINMNVLKLNTSDLNRATGKLYTTKELVMLHENATHNLLHILNAMSKLLKDDKLVSDDKLSKDNS